MEEFESANDVLDFLREDQGVGAYFFAHLDVNMGDYTPFV